MASEEQDFSEEQPQAQQSEHEEIRNSIGGLTLLHEHVGGQPTEQTPIQKSEDQRIAQSSSDSPLAAEGEPLPTIQDEQVSQSRRAPGGDENEMQSTSTKETGMLATQSIKTSQVFVISALELIVDSKESRRQKKLKESAQRALEAIKDENSSKSLDPEVIFEPLYLATDVNTIAVVTAALDCIGKLISYSYFSESSTSSNEASRVPLIERAIDTICDCFQGDATPIEVQMQILKSLLAAILNDKIIVHGAGLLKAIRQTYNIFLLSRSTANQQVAQGALGQMIGTVFERVKYRIALKESRLSQVKVTLRKENSQENYGTESVATAEDATDETNEDISHSDNTPSGPRDIPVTKHTGPRITLQTFEQRKSFDDGRIHDDVPTMITRLKSANGMRQTTAEDEEPNISNSHVGVVSGDDEEDEVFLKDAFLVFRAMCKLSTKPIPPDQAMDLRSQGMRSKLLALHTIHSILCNNMSVILSPLATIRSNTKSSDSTTLIQAIKSYLILSLSRNGSSSINRIFEVSSEIFWTILRHLRIVMKTEIEVFCREIYFSILERRNAPSFQKHTFLRVLGRLAADPRSLVEIYLNYDCDRTAVDNVFQRIVEYLSRISATPISVTAAQEQLYQNYRSTQDNIFSDFQNKGAVPPSLSTATISPVSDSNQGYPVEYSLKQESLEIIVELLRSLTSWSQQGFADIRNALTEAGSRSSVDESRKSTDTRENVSIASPYIAGTDATGTPSTPTIEDDPDELERAKQRKMALDIAVRQFNFKPQRGIKYLIQEGFINSSSPEDIAAFLSNNNRINKAALGEFLGEGDQENIAIMHAFVDKMEFSRIRFVDALRRFLQSFRLPGEAQKVDRFLLKFAERYIAGNPNAFANADTAYVLSYSVVMLNTDQHNTNLKGKRMTPEDFIKNNRGINDNSDLPDDYLRGIYEEIASNEIVLDSERETAANLGILPQASGGLAAGLGQALGGRDTLREAHVQASEQMANKTEQLFKSLLRAQRKSSSQASIPKYIPATSFKHVGPMFEVTWMAFLTALSAHEQVTHNIETIKLCMEGQKFAIRIACTFDLGNPRQAFVSSLARSTNLYNLTEMKAKNVEALKTLLDIGQTQANHLKESWRDVLTCISQLDRFQLISTGIDEGTVPDVSKAHVPSKGRGRRSLQAPQRPPMRSYSTSAIYQTDVVEESRSANMIRNVDKIFTNTANLSGEAIIYFVKALTQVSWQEIQSSGQSESPRTYSLQKIVEISGYNMSRVRFEWTNIWQILGEHFNQVGCHNNTNVVFFALNSLRQLSMQFMEIEELSGFKFQKDFLKPFEQIINNTNVIAVKDMVLRCLIQLIQARGDKVRSGWKAMFGAFTVAAREQYEAIVSLAFEIVNQIYNTKFGVVIAQGAFADLIVCLTEFSKNIKFQKKSLQAIEVLKSSVNKMLNAPECPLSARDESIQEARSGTSMTQPTSQTQEEQFWFPVLFAFHDVLMTGEDLEVRSRALNYLFDILIKYGGDYPPDFWDTLWRQLLYPIFMVLKSKSEMSKVLNDEELSVWLSTTMIQALRNMISLFTHFFTSLEYMLDRFLELLALCICQENDTLARIGSNCLQQLILQNVKKFTAEHWHKIVKAFVDLFARTEATELFSSVTSSYQSPTNGMTEKFPKADQENAKLQLDRTSIEKVADDENPLKLNGTASSPEMGPGDQVEENTATSTASSGDISPKSKQPQAQLEDYGPQSELQKAPIVVTTARRNQIITKCILQLLMIETVNELFSNDAVYARIPSPELLRLMAVVRRSYQFAKRFNSNLDLRTRLVREGFMKQPPNLLKQESGSAAVYISILFRMFSDTGDERTANREQTEQALVPLCVDIVRSFLAMDDETQQRNIVTWRPVVVEVLEGYAGFPQPDFEKHVLTFAPLAVGLLGRDMTHDLQRSLQVLVSRIFEVKLGMPHIEFGASSSTLTSPKLQSPVQSPRSPKGSSKAFLQASRRASSRGN